MTASGVLSDKEWQQVIQRVTTCGNKEQWVTASDSCDTTNENSTVHFKEWMIDVLSITETHTVLLQGMDGYN